MSSFTPFKVPAHQHVDRHACKEEKAWYMQSLEEVLETEESVDKKVCTRL